MLKKEDSLDILSPYLPIISEVITDAITEFNRDPLKLFYCNRTKSSAINDLIVSKALVKFYNTKGIRIRKKRGCTYFFIKDKFLLRFKKFDRHLRTSNIPTHQSNQFLGQQTLFDELPATVTNVFAGYTWNASQGAQSGIYLTCPAGNSNQWTYSFGSTSPVAEIIPITIKSPTPPNPNSPRKRIRATKGLKENERNTEK